MSEFLAPLNYDRAQDALRRLSLYVSYTPEGAAQAVGVLSQCYPLVFSKTEQKTFANGAVLLELRGANVTEPLVFTAHLDVSQNDPAAAPPSLALPLTAPLSRAHIVALLEALEELLRDGYRPGGDLFLALSMDGLSGGEGAKSMAAYLQKRSIHPCFVLDYGGYATMDAFRACLPKAAPLALIGVAEKGLIVGDVTAAEEDAVSRLLKGGARLSRRPRRAALCFASRQMLAAIGKKAPSYPLRFALEHARLFFPFMRIKWRNRSVMRQFFLSQRTVYALAAEGAPTAPAQRATLRFCQTVIPGEKTAAILKRLKLKLRDPELKLNASVAYEHPRRSLPEGEAWDALETAIEIQFERAVIAPCLCPRITDSRFYAAMGQRVYRFSPFMVTGEEALNGSCTVTDGALQTAVQFFRSMLSV